ncbi:Histidinol-phosphate/aromatic aminotransferase and cobyric acid decarboxylase [Rhodospirillaceae bacterium LM-1]|nr:Histidinol-phosphate/aromatic aminotransferase and cobyric acid decarboxylase [Rhodospirillaceae bacterium LM-1]
MTPYIIQPRPSVADPALSRPDWTKAQPRDPAKLWLDKNENCDPELSRVVTEVMRALPPEAYFTYPDNAPLYAKLADSLELFPEQLVLTAGSDGAIRAVFEAYISPGDVVLHTNPTFAMYSVYSRMYGAKAVALDYQPSDDGPQLLSAQIIEAIAKQRPKLVCLPNPDSPTGTVFPIREMELIIRAAGRVGALILIDEAYFPFHAESCIAWTRRFDHLVVARSTGKAWGLAGLRIGYAAASPEVAKVLHKVRPMYEVNTVAVHAFLRMLDHAGEMMQSVRRLQAGKDLFLSQMARLGYRTLKGQGNFMHVAFAANADKVHAALEPLVYYRRDFNEPCLKGYSRFSATTAQLFQPLIDRIAEVS